MKLRCTANKLTMSHLGIGQNFLIINLRVVRILFSIFTVP